jgi:hypothetical protein
LKIFFFPIVLLFHQRKQHKNVSKKMSRWAGIRRGVLTARLLQCSCLVVSCDRNHLFIPVQCHLRKGTRYQSPRLSNIGSGECLDDVPLPARVRCRSQKKHSLAIAEVKQHRAWRVLGWHTASEKRGDRSLWVHLL